MEEMRSIGEILKSLIDQSQLESGTPLFEKLQELSKLSDKERVQMSVDAYNATCGHLDEVTAGYHCEKCKDRGDRAEIDERNGTYYQVFPPCECMKVRKSIWRIMESGLAKSIKEQRLETFVAKEDWQKKMVETALKYVGEGVNEGAWLYIGGQIGSGKTHICTAVARSLLYDGKELLYMVWEEDGKRLKALVKEPEYAEEIRKFKIPEVLYIDDFFKPSGDQNPTEADQRLAFELIDYRYRNKLPTIISSERFLREILDMNESIGSRIYERAKKYSLSITRDKTRNYRRNDETLI